MNLFFKYIFCIATISVFHLSAFTQNEKNSDDHLNVLLIISDDLASNALSCYGNSVSKTPNIDALASESVVFTSAYSQYPVCGPSRASLMFGYYPHTTQTYGYSSGRENVGTNRDSWAQLFKKNGYYTARVSKIFHMGVPIDIETGSNGADDEASWTERFNSQGPEWKAEGKAELVQNNPYDSIERKGGNVMTIVQSTLTDLEHSDGKTAEKAIDLIKKHKDEPFFLAVGLVRPHVPFVAPEKYFDSYPYQQMVLPPQVTNDWDDIPAMGINYVTSLNGEMSEGQEKKAISAYYASVAYMDAQVGKILNTLEQEGISENTIIIFTSDHGFHLGEHRFWMKVSLHEESVRVPLMIKVPGYQAGISDSFVELLDLYPTTAKLAGLKISSELQGKDLTKVLLKPDEEVREFAFSTSQGGKALLIRTKKWAFIQYEEDASKGMELYDMETDPQQFNNLATNPIYKDVVNDMQSRLNNKLAELRKQKM